MNNYIPSMPMTQRFFGKTIFLNFSGLRPNFDKCKIAGIRVLENVNVTSCRMKNINWLKKVYNFWKDILELY